MNDEVRFKIDDGTAPQDVTVKLGDDGPPKSERSRERAPEVRRDELTRANMAIQREARARMEAEAETVSTRIEAERERLARLEREHVASMESGDFAAVAKAASEIAMATARIAQYEEADANCKALLRRPMPPADPVEAYMNGRTEPTKAWLRDHADFITDPRKNNKLTAAHHDAVAEGHEPDSAPYFEHVESYLGLRDGGARRSSNSGGNSREDRQAHLARVDRNNPLTHVDGNKVYLTQDEAKTATDGTVCWHAGDLAAGRINDPSLIGTAVGTKEYARRKAQMISEGHYSNRLDG